MVRYRHGGDLNHLSAASGYSRAQILDFSASINPLGPPEWLRGLVSSRLSDLIHYPDPEASDLVSAVAGRYKVREDEVVVGNGSTELFYAIPRALPVSRAVIPVPSYADYAAAAGLAGKTVVKFPLREEDGFRLDMAVLEGALLGNEMVFVGLPNNPTGLCFASDALRSLALRHPKTVFIVDEAFADFAPGLDRLIADRPPNVLVVVSLTKFYAIPGLRIGFAVGSPATAVAIRDLILPWSVNSLAQAVGAAGLADDDYAQRTRAFVVAERAYLTETPPVAAWSVCLSRRGEFPPPSDRQRFHGCTNPGRTAPPGKRDRHPELREL